jgi:hypothetical protein
MIYKCGPGLLQNCARWIVILQSRHEYFSPLNPFSSLVLENESRLINHQSVCLSASLCVSVCPPLITS